MSAFNFKSAEQTSRPMAHLNQLELEQIERVARRYGEALNERMRVVSAMRSVTVTQDEMTYCDAERKLQAIRDEMEDCSLELGHLPKTGHTQLFGD